MGAYREDTDYYNNIEVISIRGSKILGNARRIFLLHVDCVLRTLPGVLPLLPSPFANMLDLLQGRTSLNSCCLWLCTTHNIMYRCMQTHFTNAYTHAHTETEMHAWMDAHIM